MDLAIFPLKRVDIKYPGIPLNIESLHKGSSPVSFLKSLIDFDMP